MTSQTACSAAISPSRSTAGPGTSTDSRASSAYASFAPGSPQPASALAHTDEGYAGTNVSGKTSSVAPLAAASPASTPSFSIVASRSRITGSAWMHATVTGAFTSPVSQSRRSGALRGAGPGTSVPKFRRFSASSGFTRRPSRPT